MKAKMWNTKYRAKKSAIKTHSLNLEKIIEIELSAEEKSAFDKSVESVRDLMQAVKL